MTPDPLSSALGDLFNQRGELMRFLDTQSAKELPFRLALHARSLVTRLSSCWCHDRETRSAVAWIVRASHEAVGLEAIDQLRDVRLHAPETIGQLTEGQRLTGVRQRAERGELWQRQPYSGKLCLYMGLRQLGPM